jgi:hypothetical protein
MSERSQIIVLWWAIVFALIYGVAMLFLLHMVPPPSARMNADQIARWYADRHTDIRLGAVIASWSSGFMVPLTVVVAVQMARKEGGRKVWTLMTLCGGSLSSLFLVLPPVFWGVAAFTPQRAHQVTAIMHELGVLTLVTTDQFYIFMFVAIAVVCLQPTSVEHSPFPRWFGYATAWFTFTVEAGAIAFIPRVGPFSWRGVLVFWSPFGLFSVWFGVLAYLLLTNIRRQLAQANSADALTSASQPTG